MIDKEVHQQVKPTRIIQLLGPYRTEGSKEAAYEEAE
jgi:hypothetical protein